LIVFIRKENGLEPVRIAPGSVCLNIVKRG
jgi:hypothetical protein